MLLTLGDSLQYFVLASPPEWHLRITDGQYSHPLKLNLLKRDFSADASNVKWGGDISIQTRAGCA